MPRKPSQKKKPPSKPPTRAVDVDLDDDELEPEAQGAPATAASTDPRKIPRAKRLPAEEFDRFLAEYPETSGTMFYLYRLEPKIDRTYTGGDDAETNIDKGAHQKYSTAWLRSEWGSGRYQVRFKDAGKQVCDSIVDVNEYTEFPPIVDVRELVDCETNRPFINNLIARGKAYRDAQGFLVPMDPQKTNLAHGAGNNAEVVDRVLSFAEKTLNRQQQPAGPGKIEEHAGLKAVDAMVSANQAMMGQIIGLMGRGEGKGNDAMMTALLTLLTTSQTQQQNLMLEFIKSSQAGAKGNSLGSIGSILDIVDRLAESPLVGRLFKAGGADDAPWWERLADKLAPELGPIIRGVIAARAAAPPLAPATLPATPAAATPPANPMPKTETPASSSPPAGIPAGQATEIPASAVNGHAATATPPPPPPPDATAIEREQTRALGLKMLELIERDKTGESMAEMIDCSYGLAMYASIASRGKDGIKAQLQTVPEVWTALEMLQPATDQFIEEFINYGKAANAPAA